MWSLICCGATGLICVLCPWASVGSSGGASCQGIAGHYRGVSVEGRGCELYALICANDLEGIVAKRLSDPYGPRTRWLKIKNPGYTQADGCSTGGEDEMSGRARLPAGEPRKASQRRSRRAAPSKVSVTPAWRPGDRVRWRDRIGDFQRETGDGEHAEIRIADRTYRVRLGELA
jgi:hypothetical protein